MGEDRRLLIKATLSKTCTDPDPDPGLDLDLDLDLDLMAPVEEDAAVQCGVLHAAVLVPRDLVVVIHLQAEVGLVPVPALALVLVLVLVLVPSVVRLLWKVSVVI